MRSAPEYRHALLAVVIHSGSDNNALTLADRDGVVAMRRFLIGVRDHPGGFEHRVGGTRRALVHETYLVHQMYFLPIMVQPCALCGDMRWRLPPKNGQCRIGHLGTVIVREVDQFLGREKVLKVTGDVEALNGEVFDDGIRVVPGFCPAHGIVERRLSLRLPLTHRGVAHGAPAGER